MKPTCAFAVAVFAAAVANADTVKAARAEIASNVVNRTAECRYYRAWFADGLSKEACEAIMERNIAAHRRWMALEPTIPASSASGASGALCIVTSEAGFARSAGRSGLGAFMS